MLAGLMAYGQALKQRVLDAYDAGEKTRAIARRFKVSEPWCRRVKQRRNEPPRQVGGGHFKLDPDQRRKLAGFVDEKPDATLKELQARVKAELEVVISIGALWNSLRRLKFTLKKSR